MTPHDGTLADLAAAVEAGLAVGAQPDRTGFTNPQFTEAQQAFAAYRQRTAALEAFARRVLSTVAARPPLSSYGRHPKEADILLYELALEARALLATTPADGRLAVENAKSLRRGVAEATGWKVVSIPDNDGLWYAVSPEGEHHLIDDAVNATDIETAWKALLSGASAVWFFPFYDENLNSIWPLFKKHGLARTGLVMSSFLQAAPKEAAYRLCEIFLTLLEERADETAAPPAPPTDNG